MIVTEDEAKTKACCGGSGCGGIAIAVTREGLLKPACIGSACMAWRWALSGDQHNIDRSQGDDRARGYCGKAGRP